MVKLKIKAGSLSNFFDSARETARGKDKVLFKEIITDNYD
ncbi:hypothetical protein GMMP1_1500030 [Candidatus Magnetomoraceae bacterium gMMP-1]